jgi:flavin reductase (DIM6/NTAB) family NADH-FMN oxidoreductase RutF
MPFDPSEFRRVLGHWITGVSVVASRTDAGPPCGLTANAVTSLSLEPPLVLACVDRAANSHDCIHRAGFFTINVLREDGETIARRFAGADAEEKFDGISWHPAPSGAPILDQALAWIDCRVHDVHPGGDHTIFIGEVLGAGTTEGDPLIYYRGRYGRHGSGD